MNMTGRIQRYQIVNTGDFARIFPKPFVNKKVVYITDALALGLIQVYFNTETSGVLDSQLLNTSLLNSSILQKLNLSNNWTGEYDEDSGVYKIEFPSYSSGVIIYAAQFQDVN